MRKPIPADAELLMRLYEIRRDPELRRARQWFLTEFKAAEDRKSTRLNSSH